MIEGNGQRIGIGWMVLEQFVVGKRKMAELKTSMRLIIRLSIGCVMSRYLRVFGIRN